QNGNGCVFKLAQDRAGMRILYSFNNFNGDGWFAQGGLVRGSDGILYGTTQNGGTNGVGTVFRLHTDGSGYAILHAFKPYDDQGRNPHAGLIEGSDGALYGTT